jgi:ubiquinol-cytochrome c reductase cytochrome b subunit
MYIGKLLIAFLGYVLPMGQMSLWGDFLIAPNAFFVVFIKNIYYNFNCSECLGYTLYGDFCSNSITSAPLGALIGPNKIRAEKRIGPHNIDILSIIFGTLLGDGYAEKRINGTRISFYQESTHSDYLLWLHSLISELGYCNSTKPEVRKRLGVKNKIRNVIRFKTWTYSSFNWIYDLCYILPAPGSKTNHCLEGYRKADSQIKLKIVPSLLGQFLTPLALSI